VRHRQAVTIVEVIHVEAKAAVGFEVDETIQDNFLIDRLAKRRQPHELIFAAVHLKTAVISECGIEQAERMRKAQLLSETNPVATADPEARRAPFADAVE